MNRRKKINNRIKQQTRRLTNNVCKNDWVKYKNTTRPLNKQEGAVKFKYRIRLSPDTLWCMKFGIWEGQLIRAIPAPAIIAVSSPTRTATTLAAAATPTTTTTPATTSRMWRWSMWLCSCSWLLPAKMRRKRHKELGCHVKQSIFLLFLFPILKSTIARIYRVIQSIHWITCVIYTKKSRTIYFAFYKELKRQRKWRLDLIEAKP